jgi:prophage antirepressor-like protein
MANKLIDLYNHLLKYNDKTVYIAFHTKTQEPYFHAKQLCELLDYNDIKQTIKINVEKNDIFYLHDIVKNYKVLYKNVQGHTKFLNEAGLYSLILKSKKAEAKIIFNWITHEVMPSIRQFGEYKLNHKLKKQIDDLNNIIKKQKDEIGILKHNLKKPIYKKGGMVYLLRSIENTVEIDDHDIVYMKFGRTKNMKNRKPVYDTCTKNRVQILKQIPVKDPKNIESCVIKKMEEYRYQNKKEYFECSFKTIIEEIASCIKFYENIDIDTTLEIHEMNRNNVINNNENILLKIIDDKEYNELCNKPENESSEDESFSDDSSEDESNNESDVELEDEFEQEGGVIDFKYKANKYKLKYLELKYDLLNSFYI